MQPAGFWNKYTPRKQRQECFLKVAVNMGRYMAVKEPDQDILPINILINFGKNVKKN